MEKKIKFVLYIVIFINTYIYRSLSTNLFVNNGLRGVNLIILIALFYIHREQILENKNRFIILLCLGVLGFGAIGLFFFKIIDLKYMMPIMMSWLALMVAYALYGFMEINGILFYLKNKVK